MSETGEEREARWPDLAGRIEDGRHILPVRVYHEDTDFTGLVYHANFLKFCERARSDMVRLAGISQTDLFSGEGEQEAAAFVVRHMDIDFLKPARMNDLLEVITTVEDLGGAAMTLLQEVRRGETVVARLHVKIVLVSASGKVMRLDALVRAALERFVNEEV
ncbi:MAG: YbgC/FadM family acyl-CoA thioesterase [Hyphomicrobiaceae bacterium]|nr:YbgC/FadM family acyl-CoA thioesterase [Hyphomicrobiaceae bacterium]